MTTPERLRRRQIREGFAIMVLGLASLVYVGYDHHESSLRDECMTDSFHDLSSSLTVRSDLSVRTDQIKVVSEKLQDQADELQNQKIGNTARLIKQVFAAETPQESFAAYLDYQHALNRIEREAHRLDVRQSKLLKRAAKVTVQRAKTDIPPFPTGKCSGLTKEKNRDSR